MVLSEAMEVEGSKLALFDGGRLISTADAAVFLGRQVARRSGVDRCGSRSRTPSVTDDLRTSLEFAASVLELEEALGGCRVVEAAVVEATARALGLALGARCDLLWNLGCTKKAADLERTPLLCGPPPPPPPVYLSSAVPAKKDRRRPASEGGDASSVDDVAVAVARVRRRAPATWRTYRVVGGPVGDSFYALPCALLLGPSRPPSAKALNLLDQSGIQPMMLQGGLTCATARAGAVAVARALDASLSSDDDDTSIVYVWDAETDGALSRAVVGLVLATLYGLGAAQVSAHLDQLSADARCVASARATVASDALLSRLLDDGTKDFRRRRAAPLEDIPGLRDDWRDALGQQRANLLASTR